MAYVVYFFFMDICLYTLENINKAHVIGIQMVSFFSYQVTNTVLRWTTIPLLAECSGPYRKLGAEHFIILCEWQRDVMCVYFCNVWGMCFLLHNVMFKCIFSVCIWNASISCYATFSCITSLHSLDVF